MLELPFTADAMLSCGLKNVEWSFSAYVAPGTSVQQILKIAAGRKGQLGDRRRVDIPAGICGIGLQRRSYRTADANGLRNGAGRQLGIGADRVANIKSDPRCARWSQSPLSGRKPCKCREEGRERQ